MKNIVICQKYVTGSPLARLQCQILPMWKFFVFVINRYSAHIRLIASCHCVLWKWSATYLIADAWIFHFVLYASRVCYEPNWAHNMTKIYFASRWIKISYPFKWDNIVGSSKLVYRIIGEFFCSDHINNARKCSFFSKIKGECLLFSILMHF